MKICLHMNKLIWNIKNKHNLKKHVINSTIYVLKNAMKWYEYVIYIFRSLRYTDVFVNLLICILLPLYSNWFLDYRDGFLFIIKDSSNLMKWFSMKACSTNRDLTAFFISIFVCVNWFDLTRLDVCPI